MSENFKMDQRGDQGMQVVLPLVSTEKLKIEKLVFEIKNACFYDRK